MSFIIYLRCFNGIVLREALRFVHQKERFFSALVRPLVWLGIFAAGFRSVLGVSIMILLITSDSKEPSLAWIFSGVVLMFYASWSSSATIPQSIAGMAPFLIVWLLSDDDDDLEFLLLPFKKKSARMKFARAITWYGTASYLLLTWILLTVEIDGENN